MSHKVPSNTDFLLAIALASGKNMQQAADEVGICRKTVQRRLNNPRFRQKVANLRGQLVAEALGKLSDNMTRAAESLTGLLDDEDRNLRFRAARALMYTQIKLRESTEITERIRNVETVINRKQGGTP